MQMPPLYGFEIAAALELVEHAFGGARQVVHRADPEPALAVATAIVEAVSGHATRRMRKRFEAAAERVE